MLVYRCHTASIRQPYTIAGPGGQQQSVWWWLSTVADGPLLSGREERGEGQILDKCPLPLSPLNYAPRKWQMSDLARTMARICVLVWRLVWVVGMQFTEAALSPSIFFCLVIFWWWKKKELKVELHVQRQAKCIYQTTTVLILAGIDASMGVAPPYQLSSRRHQRHRPGIWTGQKAYCFVVSVAINLRFSIKRRVLHCKLFY